ncbi:hypothetical protein G6O69_15440 [Pseudenhygromyxa sp. WMMC2535]|uniref:hypothetical protein n=1 Tax=Pseudenhygromyxa sp. WMMC2535 TaxID=2712867 RepID=UPI001555CD58|nr:hypothetical protein [Pseudenhygromyxa sp. WMMC2535]NVB39236.1 hypothetical protein [Pseudenhygromyxa sp. WMMC2535]
MSASANPNLGGFEDRLAITLSLSFAGTSHELPGGSVKLVELELALHGFRGVVEFTVLDDASYGGGSTDALVSDFIAQAPAEISLSLAPVFDAPEGATSPDPITLAGLVTRRSLEEIQLREHADLPLIARRYRVEFCDPARALWTQHFPCRLYTTASLEAVINDQLGDEISVRYDWSALGEDRRMVFVHLPVEHGASFLDFVIWQADVRGGYFSYDYACAEYCLAGSRDTSGEVAGLFGDDLAKLRVRVPEVPRHAVEVCNSYAEEPTSAAITQAQAATGIRHDRLLRSPIAQDADDRVTLEKARLLLPSYEAELEFARMPIVTPIPGGLVELLAANRWSTASAIIGQTWLVCGLSLRAAAVDEQLDGDLEIGESGYAIQLSARLIQREDARPLLPDYRAPSYPGFVEGKVVCSLGEDGEKTWESTRNADTSLDEYAVAVPLWDSQVVYAPFAPLMGSGNVYLPCYRDERVLLALELEDARVDRLLDWREGAALSKDVQGEHILWGKSGTSNTSLSHVYEEDAPVLDLLRTNASDTVRLTLSEGNLVLHVEEQAGEG